LLLVRATDADLEALVALQHAAYARNMIQLGVVPEPISADYARILRDMEVWIKRNAMGGLDCALIVQPRERDLLIWSIATHPARQGEGLGRAMLEAAFSRMRAHRVNEVRLYTGTLLERNWTWYQRRGFTIERIDELPDRSVMHMLARVLG
jgi:ribosomal protein S18 acetylase RimI-like enzyme